LTIDQHGDVIEAPFARGFLVSAIGGEDFAQALLRVWLGAEPADSGLKRAMLGRD
jgi:hypothetical protein